MIGTTSLWLKQRMHWCRSSYVPKSPHLASCNRTQRLSNGYAKPVLFITCRRSLDWHTVR